MASEVLHVGTNGNATTTANANGDVDRTETKEWLDSLDAVLHHAGPDRAGYLLGELRQKAIRSGVEVALTSITPYINTIPTARQAPLPGIRDIERSIKSLVRWNAMA